MDFFPFWNEESWYLVEHELQRGCAESKPDNFVPVSGARGPRAGRAGVGPGKRQSEPS